MKPQLISFNHSTTHQSVCHHAFLSLKETVTTTAAATTTLSVVADEILPMVLTILCDPGLDPNFCFFYLYSYFRYCNSFLEMFQGFLISSLALL